MTRESLRQNYQVANQRIAATWNFRDIDLSVARNDVEIPLAGDFLQIPTVAFSGETSVDLGSSVGVGFVKFDEKDAKPYYISSGSTIRQRNNPFGTLYLTNEAQAGAKMRIYTSALADSDPQAVTNFSTDVAESYAIDDSANAMSTTAAIIVTARSERKSGIIQNNDITNDLLIVNSAGTIGIIVPKNGGTYTFNHTAAVYGRVTAGSIVAANIIVNEEF